MISESVIIFGATGNVVMVLNGELPKDAPLMFKVGENHIDLMADQDVLYSEDGLSMHTCERLRQKNEIGLIETLSESAIPSQLSSVAYQIA